MNILKTFAAAALMVACSGSAFGATNYLFENPDNRIFFGVRASLDVSSAANGGGYYSNKSGFAVGGVYNIPLWMNLYFEPGLSAFYNTFGTTDFGSFKIDVPIVNPEPEGPTTEEKDVYYQIDGTIRNFGFRVPLMVGYHFDVTDDIQVRVFTGPQLNMSLSARYHRQAIRIPEVNTPEETISLFGTEGFKHLDAQWKFGAGITYQNYTLDLSGSWGMTHMKDATTLLKRDLRRNLFSITLGYNF